MESRVRKVVNSEGSVWKTESAFYSWFRGGLRKGLWNTHPVKINFLNNTKFKAPLGKKTKTNPKGMVFCHKCEVCGETKRSSEVEVDHKDQVSIKPLKADILGFIMRMVLITQEDLRIVCKECHRIITHAQRKNTTFNEAKADKLAIEACKDTIKNQVEDLIEYGYNESEIKNSKQRREAFYKHFLGEIK